MDTPVALIIFNRPDKTAKVFESISKAKPGQLFIIADGPRAHVPDDVEKCKAARRITENIDWDCKVYKNFSDENMGCGLRPASGISWVFEHVDRAMILEDDCLPHPAFFRFCDELLEKYASNDRIMQINGSNLQKGKKITKDSYYFSQFNICWGWASWRRAWRHYDIMMKKWPALKESDWLLNILANEACANYWTNIFDKAYNGAGNVPYWDYQWLFSVWANNGLAVSPRTPLISNIGFGEDATHTKETDNGNAIKKFKKLSFPLKHPAEIKTNQKADGYLKTIGTPGGFNGSIHAYIKNTVKKMGKRLLGSGPLVVNNMLHLSHRKSK